MVAFSLKLGDVENFISVKVKIFSGILPIGTMGCTYYYGLVLTGKYAGRVVGIDTDLQIPLFMEEENFLEWYEHYLDGVLEKKK